jgi:DNA-binding MarR family transcriptional regulator
MRALATHFACDASNVTGVADRLEAQGYVERVPGPDRQVRLLRLTTNGQKLRADLAEQVAHAPSPADRLTPLERSELHALLDKMVAQ